MSDMEMTTTNTALANEAQEEKLARLAAEINTIKAQTLALVQNATLEIGKRLIQAKGAVGHGNWSLWLKDNVDYSERTAQNIIAIYERFGDSQQKLFGASADPEQVAKLNRSQMLALMSIKDEETCFNFMEEHKEDLQDMSKRELEAAIKELNAVKAREEQNSKFTKLKQEQLDKANAEIADLKAKYQHDMDELQAQLKEAGDSKELTELKERLATMEKDYIEMETNTGAAIEEKEKYQRLFNEAQGAATETQTKLENEIAKLKEENETLKNTPLEPSVVEKVPEETAKEIEDLKAKIEELKKAKPEKSEAEKNFSYHFYNLRAELTTSMEWLGKIEGDKADKYKDIFKKMLTATMEAI